MADDDSPQRNKTNTAFLARVLAGTERTNQRVIDSNSSKAARMAVGASGAASLRPLLQRSMKKGPQAVRRAVLSAVQQQKLTLCSALLSEVAQTFGFKLIVHNLDGSAALPLQDADAEVATGVFIDTETDGQDKADSTLGQRTDMLTLEPLEVELSLGSEEDQDPEQEVMPPAEEVAEAQQPARPRPIANLASRLTANAFKSAGITSGSISAAGVESKSRGMTKQQTQPEQEPQNEGTTVLSSQLPGVQLAHTAEGEDDDNTRELSPGQADAPTTDHHKPIRLTTVANNAAIISALQPTPCVSTSASPLKVGTNSAGTKLPNAAAAAAVLRSVLKAQAAQGQDTAIESAPQPPSLAERLGRPNSAQPVSTAKSDKRNRVDQSSSQVEVLQASGSQAEAPSVSLQGQQQAKRAKSQPGMQAADDSGQLNTAQYRDDSTCQHDPDAVADRSKSAGKQRPTSACAQQDVLGVDHDSGSMLTNSSDRRPTSGRPPKSMAAGLFGAAMRDIKKVQL